MRILMTTDTIGGVWTFTKELAGELLAGGCAVALVSLGRIPNNAQLEWADSQFLRWGTHFRFAACDAPLEWMQGNARAMSDAAPLIERIAHEFGADLLLSSQFCFGALPLNVPRVVVAHSDVLSWARACRSEPLPMSPWLDRYCELVSEGLRCADGVVAPTKWMLGALGENFHLPRETRAIPNGRSLPAVPENTARRLQAVSAGRLWDEGKNLKMLAHLDPPMPVLVAGELEHESSRLSGGCGKAVLLGPLDEDELLALFRQSSVYICSSQYEPFGLAPLEAALCGCALLANDIPSLREVWEDDALYFHDADSLGMLLAALGSHPHLLNHARMRAQNQALAFTAKRMADGYLDFLQGISQPAVSGHYVA